MPDWRVVELDETHCWILDNLPEYRTKIKRILGRYLYDRNRHVYACEMTPSFEAHMLGSFAEMNEDATDSERDDANEMIAGNEDWSESVRYYHSLPEGRKIHPTHSSEEDEYEEQLEAAIDYARSNW